MRQPQFQKLFFESFGPKPRKVKYRLRSDTNRGHDEVFLASLIHDARFLRQEVTLRGGKLLLKLERDCWERGQTGKPDGSISLHNSLAVLRMRPVEEVVWAVPHDLLTSQEELWIYSIYRVREPVVLAQAAWTLVLDGLNWHATIYFEECDEPLVELEDKTVPALWADIQGNPKLLARFRGT